LVFSGRQLVDDRLVSGYNLKPDSKIYLFRTGAVVVLSIDTGYRRFVVEVSASSSVYDIKGFLRMIEGIPVEDQALQFEGRWLEIDETLASAGIRQGAVLYMQYSEFVKQYPDEKYEQIFVKTLTGALEPFMLDLYHDTVQNLKNCITYRLGIEQKDMTLVFGGKKLSDDNATLADSRIEEGSTVNLAMSLVSGQWYQNL
jgi:Ubiquitin family